MSRFTRHRRYFQVAALALLVLAFIGPWAADYDGLPPAEWCAPPNYILGERCARFMPGTEILSVGGMVLASIPAALRANEISLLDIWREFLFLLIILLLGLPFLSTLLIVMQNEHPRRKTLYRLGLALGLIPAGLIILLGILQPPAPPIARTWGVWLYLALVAALFGLEMKFSKPLRPTLTVLGDDQQSRRVEE